MEAASLINKASFIAAWLYKLTDVKTQVTMLLSVDFVELIVGETIPIEAFLS